MNPPSHFTSRFAVRSNQDDAVAILPERAEALRDFEASLALKRDNPRTFMGHGMALVALNQPEAAQPSFRAACQLGWLAACKRIESGSR
jgi:hypothetical protein